MYSNWNNVFVFWYCKIKLLFKMESTTRWHVRPTLFRLLSFLVVHTIKNQGMV